MKAVAIVGLLACLAAGCSALPTAGPTVKEVKQQEFEDSQLRFDLVDIDDNVVTVQTAAPPESFSARFKKYGKPPQPKIGIGDTRRRLDLGSRRRRPVRRVADRRHVSPGSRNVTIPEQVVGPRRHDHACRSPGRSRSPDEPRSRCSARSNSASPTKAIEPQAIVTVTKSLSNSVTVAGEIVAGARIPLSVRGDRLLDVIAAAGGAKSPVYETFVRLSRGGVTATIPMERLVSNPAENIYAQPGDVLTLVRMPQSFTVFGAAGRTPRSRSRPRRMTLAEALAKAGGLQDQRADPAGVFLFRYEPPPMVKALGRPVLATGPDALTPVIYRLDLRNAKSFFLAQRFPIEDKDIIYVANADLNELQKFFTLLNTLTGPVITGIVVKNAVQ